MITENFDEQKQLIPRFAQNMMRRSASGNTLKSEEGSQ